MQSEATLALASQRLITSTACCKVSAPTSWALNIIGRLTYLIGRSVTQHLLAPRATSLGEDPQRRFSLLFHPFSLAFSHTPPPIISNLYLYCSIYVYNHVLLRGQDPRTCDTTTPPTHSLSRVTRLLECFRTLPTFAPNAQVQKARYLTFFECFSFLVSHLTHRTDHPYADAPYRFIRHVERC